MAELSGRPRRMGREGGESRRRPAFAALDLGSNNCRLLIAEPQGAAFRVIGGYSQIVRLGEGVSRTGRLSESAMARAMDALAACAARMAARPLAAVGCIATQACRSAENGAEFLAHVQRELGLSFEIISPEEEARLAVLGCANLIDSDAQAALIVDIGGGSTELSWVDASAAPSHAVPPIRDWVSTPIGVVTMAERWPEPDPQACADWYEHMVQSVYGQLRDVFAERAALAALFEQGLAHIIGTSGAVTSLAGVHLDLARYQRTKVDGIWLTPGECRAAVAKLMALTQAGRARHPCIGRDRADLVLAGGAILEAVLRLWPTPRLRVADRGLREGVLMTLMARHRAGRR